MAASPTPATIARAVLERTPARVLAGWAVGASALALLFLALHLAGVDLLRLTRDASQTAGGAEVGILSTSGLGGWGAAAAVLGVLATAAGGRERRFFGCTAVLVVVLLVDDAALLHEQVLPSVQIPEKA